MKILHFTDIQCSALPVDAIFYFESAHDALQNEILNAVERKLPVIEMPADQQTFPYHLRCVRHDVIDDGVLLARVAGRFSEGSRIPDEPATILYGYLEGETSDEIGREFLEFASEVARANFRRLTGVAYDVFQHLAENPGNVMVPCADTPAAIQQRLLAHTSIELADSTENPLSQASLNELLDVCADLIADREKCRERCTVAIDGDAVFLLLPQGERIAVMDYQDLECMALYVMLLRRTKRSASGGCTPFEGFSLSCFEEVAEEVSEICRRLWSTAADRAMANIRRNPARYVRAINEAFSEHLSRAVAVEYMLLPEPSSAADETQCRYRIRIPADFIDLGEFAETD